MSIMRVFLVVTPLAMCACGNLRTQTIDLSQASDGREIAGLPFILNKPQFTIARVPADGTSGADTYQMAIAYVPDPATRYAVNLHPSPTSSVDWTVQWDENGALSDTNAKTTDQTVAILTSVVKLAVAAAAFDVNQPSQKDTVEAIDKRLTDNLALPQPKVWDETAGGWSIATSAEKIDLSRTWAQMKPALETLASSGKLSSYLYDTASERKVLETALHLATPNPARLNRATDYKDPKDFPDPVPNPDPVATKALKKKLSESWNNTADHIEAAYKILDIDSLNKINADAAKVRQKRESDFASSNTVPQAYRKDYNIMLQTQVIKLSLVALDLLKTPPNDFLLGNVNLTLQQWEYKKIQDLNRRIDKAALIQPSRYDTPGATNAELQKLYRMKAAVLGQGKTYEDIVALQKMKPDDPKRFQAAQQSIDVLAKKLADAEAAVATLNPAKKPDAPVVADFFVASPEEAIDGAWVASHVPGHPKYIVVLKQAKTNLNH
ncbi:hypothetical protein [Paraburkholderia sp. RL17-347-BIC-D]|uniref:hypothetical protein n=1 Tax=Paraburkholderia sp. RL17-347-BIC-D TaxID=3031632 RepID=UPI0038BCDA33